MTGIKTILIIEKEPNLAFLIQTALKENTKYEVFWVANEKEAKKVCEGLKFDLIFFSLFPGGQSDDELLGFLRALDPLLETKIVGMAGLGTSNINDGPLGFIGHLLRAHNADPEKRSAWFSLPEEKVKELGFSILLPKPFSKRTLLLLARALLGS